MSEIVQKELPEKWEWSTLGEVAELLRGINYKKPDASNEPTEGKLPVLRANNIGNGLNFEGLVYVPKNLIKQEQIIKKGDIIIAMSSGSKRLVGKAAQATKDYNGAYGAFCANLRVTAEIEPKYVAYYYSSQDNLKRISASSSGSNINNLKREHILDAPIPIAPPEQQKRIVAKIEQLFSHVDAGIEALKKSKQLLKQYRQSVLKAAVTGELTKEWREANNRSFDNWQESTIGEIAKVQTGKTPKRTTEEFWKSGTIPWLTSSATNEAFTHHADQFVTQLAVDNGLKLFESGTLLLAMYGEGKTRGQVTEITFQATCNQACAAIIVDKDKASCAFIRLRLNENYEQVRKAASGGNQPNLNLSKVREISLPLPPLTEQAEIVSQVELKFEAINRLEKDLETQLFKAEKNKQSILASAFSGNL